MKKTDQKREVKVAFQHTEIDNNRVTFASKKVEEGKFAVSVSICSSSEKSFKKSKGRMISKGRLLKGVKSTLVEVNASNPSRALQEFSKRCENLTISELKKKMDIKTHALNS